MALTLFYKNVKDSDAECFSTFMNNLRRFYRNLHYHSALFVSPVSISPLGNFFYNVRFLCQESRVFLPKRLLFSRYVRSQKISVIVGTNEIINIFCFAICKSCSIIKGFVHTYIHIHSSLLLHVELSGWVGWCDTKQNKG